MMILPINMRSNRDLMNQARVALAGKWGRAALATFVWLLIMMPIQTIPGVGIVVMILLTGPFMAGWAIYSLKLTRGQPAELKDIFSAFNEFGRYLGACIMLNIYVLLWSMLFIIPGIMAFYSYRLTYFLLADDPDISVNEAISKSRKMMYGKRWKYFCLILQFFGWMILAMLTFGIAFFWLWPYIQTTLAAFYEDIRINQA